MNYVKHEFPFWIKKTIIGQKGTDRLWGWNNSDLLIRNLMNAKKVIPPEAWGIDKSQILTLLVECCSRNRELSDQGTFWVCMKCSLSLHSSWQTGVAPGVVFSCCAHLPQSSTCLAFRNALLHTWCNKWLFGSLLLSYQLQAVQPFSSKVGTQKHRDASTGKSYLLNSFWNIQQSPPGQPCHVQSHSNHVSTLYSDAQTSASHPDHAYMLITDVPNKVAS